MSHTAANPLTEALRRDEKSFLIENYARLLLEDVEQNGHLDASVTQIRSLLNGYVEKNIICNKKAVAMKNMEADQTMEKKVSTIFYTNLHRKPDSHEQRDAKDAVKRHGDEAYADLLWTLVNSHEFLFVQ